MDWSNIAYSENIRGRTFFNKKHAEVFLKFTVFRSDPSPPPPTQFFFRPLYFFHIFFRPPYYPIALRGPNFVNLMITVNDSVSNLPKKEFRPFFSDFCFGPPKKNSDAPILSRVKKIWGQIVFLKFKFLKLFFWVRTFFQIKCQKKCQYIFEFPEK